MGLNRINTDSVKSMKFSNNDNCCFILLSHILKNLNVQYMIKTPVLDRTECLPIVTNVPKSTVVTQFDLIQPS